MQLWCSNLTLPWDYASTACKQIYLAADHKSPSAVLCNASAIAASFILILALIPDFMPMSYLAHQQVQFLLLVLLMFITLAFVWQFIFEKRVPAELSFLRTLGMGKGLLLVGHCSF